ncbi:hypothetical protein PAMA_003526 [Pampus argenteus]
MKTMDTLLSDVDKLCTWLSSDPDYILDQCGDILTRNEYKEVEKQSGALDKMETLLKIMQKGEEKAQSFFEILKQHQAHYPQLQQFFKASEGSSAPSQFADDNSVITTREMTNIKAKSISMKIETVEHPGCGSSGDVVGQSHQAGFTSLRGSVICADKLSNCTIDGDIDLSVTVKQAPRPHAGNITSTSYCLYICTSLIYVIVSLSHVAKTLTLKEQFSIFLINCNALQESKS